ncbi:MAG: adenosylcobinamide-phosphate synthase CbiB [Paracoccaceae bacterium]
MSLAAALLLAALIDAALGEPRSLWSRLPHPAVVMGRLIGWADRRFNRGTHRRAKGAALMAALVALAAGLGMIPRLLPYGVAFEIALAAILLAQRSLVDHVRAVADGLAISLDDARHAVSMIVGRDTADMDAPAIARAAIESGAENFSDGVIAPALWFLIAGLPGLLAYKIINTGDSMIGYRTPRHADFGWAAARLDDVANLIPARISAALIALSHGLFIPRQIARDARHHRSPNAGWPEAAMAHTLGIALAGPRSYAGEMRDFPWINAQGRRDAGRAEITRATRALWRAWGLGLALVAIVALA